MSIKATVSCIFESGKSIKRDVIIDVETLEYFWLFQGSPHAVFAKAIEDGLVTTDGDPPGLFFIDCTRADALEVEFHEES
jgi:hypothetical protein